MCAPEYAGFSTDLPRIRHGFAALHTTLHAIVLKCSQRPPNSVGIIHQFKKASIMKRIFPDRDTPSPCFCSCWGWQLLSTPLSTRPINFFSFRCLGKNYSDVHSHAALRRVGPQRVRLRWPWLRYVWSFLSSYCFILSCSWILRSLSCLYTSDR